MEKVRVEFSIEAFDSLERLRNGPLLISQLAERYYNELFDFPPEFWGRVRHELGHDTFVSERHCVFDIRGSVEETKPVRTLKITHFELRRKARW